MTNATTPTADATTAAPEEIPLQTLGLIVAMAKLEVDRATARQAVVRERFRSSLAKVHAETGAKSVNLTLPDGRKFGAATIPDSKDSTEVQNDNAFFDWVMEHSEWETEVETITRVLPTFQSRLLKEIGWAQVAETQPKFDTVDLTDDDGNLVDYDGNLLEAGQEPLTITIPVLDGDGEQVTHDVPVTGEDGEPVYQAIHMPTGEVVPGLRYVKGRTKTETFSLRFERPKKGAAVVEGVIGDGDQMLAEFMATHSLASLIPAELEALVVDGK